ncbi:MAG: UvrD-helicase domain-containing protein, partial [Desulfoplanes sp.]
FCQRILTENAFESRETFDAEIITDQSGLVNGIAEDYWRVHCSDISSLFAEYLQDNSRKFSLKVLGSLAHTLMNHQETVVEPLQAAADTRELEGEFVRRFREACAAWDQGHEEVREILFDHPALNRKTYGVKTAVPKVLREIGDMFAEGEPTLVVPEKFELVTQSFVLTHCKKNSEPPEHPFFAACDALFGIHASLVAGFLSRIVSLKAGFAAYLIRELADRKTKSNVYGYDDMLLRVRNVLKDGNNVLQDAVRSTYAAALIDEFQDTDPVQYDIFSTLFQIPSHILFLIGDPKQAIYGFRGADIFTYMQAARKADRAYTMDTNWRSEPGLLDAVNHLFSRMTNPFVFRDIGFESVLPAPTPMCSLEMQSGFEAFFEAEFPDRPDIAATCTRAATAPLHLWFLDRDMLVPNSKKDIPKDTAILSLAQGVAAEASRLVRMGRQGLITLGRDHEPLEPRHLAVLVRTNRQAVMVQEALRRCGVPGVIAGSGNVFHTDQALELLRVMEGVAECGVPSRVKSALATRMLGFDAPGLDALVTDEKKWDQILTEFVAFRENWEARGFMGFFSAMMSGWQVRPRLLGMEGGERMLTNVLHLMEILHSAEGDHELTMSGLLTWFTEQCHRENAESEEHQLRLESDERAVQIVTIHKSKGLQYPVVFCPFLFEGVRKNTEILIHDPHSRTSLLDMSDPASAERKTRAYKEILAENMRLAYVALTRAEFRCYLACGRVNEADFSAMAYIFSGYRPGEEFEIDGLATLWKGLDNATMRQNLGKLEQEIPGCAVYPLPEGPGQFAVLQDSAMSARLELPVFSRIVEQSCGISSFSSLVRGRDHTARPGFDEPLEPSGEAVENGGDSFFSFPKGAGPGTMLHDVLEHLNFLAAGSEESNVLIREKLQRYGMDEKWTPVVMAAMQEITHVDLGHGFSFSQVRETLPELEFYYPLKNVTFMGLSSLYRKWGQRLPKAFTERMDGLRFSPRQGFMLGFIDLVFRHEGKWYLVDWKSNHLGNDFDQYRQENLTQAMAEHMYFLQSHIYTVALDGYLQMRLPETYTYERDFGGIIYVFLRGVNAELGPGYGMYREKPEPGFVRELSAYLIG